MADKIDIEIIDNDEDDGCACGGNCGCQEDKDNFEKRTVVNKRGVYIEDDDDLDSFVESHTQLVNKTDLEFIDISSEEYREYVFPTGKTLRINKPLKLHVSDSGGHRIFTAQGISWYVKPAEGWAIKWVAKDEYPNFVK